MDGQSEDPEDARRQPGGTELAPPLDSELETDEVPESMVSDFSSLTTPYCWVITEDAVAGYDGAEPSAVGKSGPGQAVAGDVTEALTAGRFFRLVDGKAANWSSGGCTTRAAGTSSRRWTISAAEPGALNIEFRAEGGWQAA